MMRRSPMVVVMILLLGLLAGCAPMRSAAPVPVCETPAVDTVAPPRRDALLRVRRSAQDTTTRPRRSVALRMPNAAKSAGVEGSAAIKKSEVTKLALKDAIELALRANRGLADARDRAESARLSIVAADAEFELKFIPAGEAGVSGSSSDSESSLGVGMTLQKKLPIGTTAAVTPGVTKVGGEYRTAADVQITQPLLRGLSREYNLDGVSGAKFAARSARRALYLTRVDTVLATVYAVYEVVRQRELVRLNEDSERRLRGHAEASRAKGKIGLASPIDVYRATIQLKDAQDNLVSAREAHGDALDNLRVILALPLDRELDVSAPLSYSLVRIKEREGVQIALKNRVELAQARDTVRETKRQSRVSRHNILPEVNLALNYSRSGQDGRFDRSMGFDDQTWGVSLMTSTDIARTAERAAYEQSLLAVRAAQRGLGLRRDDVVRQVKRQARSLRKAEKRIAIQREQIKQAEGQLAVANLKFKRGLANNFDQIQAEAELRRAQTNLLSAVVNYIVGRYRLRAALGTLLEAPEGF